MLWLYILLGVLLLIFLLLLLPIGIKVNINGESKIWATIGFIKIQLLPQKEKKPKKDKKKKKKKKQKQTETAKKEPEKKKSLLSEKGLGGLVDLIKKIAELSQNVLKGFFKHIIIKRMLISIVVAEGDAAKTAINYGYYCSVVYPAFGIIVRNAKCRKYGIDIAPDFDEKVTSHYTISFNARIRILWILTTILKNGMGILDIFKELT